MELQARGRSARLIELSSTEWWMQRQMTLKATSEKTTLQTQATEELHVLESFRMSTDLEASQMRDLQDANWKSSMVNNLFSLPDKEKLGLDSIGRLAIAKDAG